MTHNSPGIEALERRVQVMEDKWEILALLSAYGPAVDSGSAETAASLWLTDGVYDVDSGTLRGHSDLVDMIKGEQHQSFIMNGAAHMMSTPSIELDGDTAVVTGHTQLITRVPDTAAEFRVLRITANRWELVRTGGQWRVSRRVGRLLDGRADARKLLGAGANADADPTSDSPSERDPDRN
ncbi:nuclear transport factor 2 family protein [Williamsia muralis]|uniref:nuclear transport factor 2 family protein n=1 Tax=Williamsia marianensis TaxID=85044 RepID=UPI003808EC4F